MESVMNIYKALADPTRLRIALVLKRRALCVCELVVVLNLPQPTVSRHLGKLRDANLVRINRDAKFVTYSLTDDAFVAQLVDATAERLSEDPQIAADHSRMADREELRDIYRREYR